IPFLAFTMSQTAIIHLSMPSAESSKIVPTLTVNCFLHPLQNHMRRVEIKECSVEPQRGQVTLPVGQRRDTAYSKVFCGSEKKLTASCNVLGSWSVLFMGKVSHGTSCVSSILLPLQVFILKVLMEERFRR